MLLSNLQNLEKKIKNILENGWVKTDPDIYAVSLTTLKQTAF